MKCPDDAKFLVTAFCDNVKQLCHTHHLPAIRLAEHAGISPSIAYRLLNPKTTKDTNPTLDTMCRIAAVFQLPLWMLLVPNFPFQVLHDGQMDKLMTQYIAMSKQVQAILDSIVTPHIQ